MEGPPAAPEKNEKEPITDEQCIEAMKTGKFELVQEWYAEQQKIAEKSPVIGEHLNLILRMARLQQAAGLKEYATETLEAAHMDAMGQEDYEAARSIEDVLDLMKKG